MRAAFGGQVPYGSIAVLAGWAVLGSAAAARWFRWE
jgi:ABC-2 type transport system permease protein